MIGNKYSGDTIASEFYKLITLKKMAYEGGGRDVSTPDLPTEPTENTLSLDEDLNPEEFLRSLDEVEISDGIDQNIKDLESWSQDGVYNEQPDAGASQAPTYSEDMNYLLDQRAAKVLNGLGKIAGSLQQKGEGFAADMVAATAKNIKDEMVKDASMKLEAVSLLKKVASDIEDEGDRFTADIIKATILKIKNS